MTQSRWQVYRSSCEKFGKAATACAERLRLPDRRLKSFWPFPTEISRESQPPRLGRSLALRNMISLGFVAGQSDIGYMMQGCHTLPPPPTPWYPPLPVKWVVVLFGLVALRVWSCLASSPPPPPPEWGLWSFWLAPPRL